MCCAPRARWRHRRSKSGGQTRNERKQRRGRCFQVRGIRSAERKNEREQAVANGPTHQFLIFKIIPIDIGGIDFSFTNASLFMVASAVLSAGFLYYASAPRSVISRR